MNLPGTRSLGLGLIFIALLPLSNSAQRFSDRQVFVADSVPRQAIVVRQQPVARSNSREVQAVVEYRDEQGNLHQASSNVSAYPPPYAIGERLDILVDKNDPQTIRVDSFTGTWFEIVFYLIPALLTFAGGLAMLMRARKR